MNRDYKCLSKGFYEYAQTVGLVSVSQYMFVRMRSDKGKYLVLKFANEANFTVNTMEFILTQLDTSGKTLSRRRVRYDKLSFEPDSVYIPEERIPIEEDCTDFRITLSYMRSKNTEYSLFGGEVFENKITCDNNSQDGKLEEEAVIKHFSVRTHKTENIGAAFFIFGMALLIMIGIAVVDLCARYIVEELSSKEDEETYEITESAPYYNTEE